MASLARLQERVASMMRAGASLDHVETEVVEPAELDSEQKAALWLFAWSFLEGQEQRAELARHLLDAGD
jgi:hypothetical protein